GVEAEAAREVRQDAGDLPLHALVQDELAAREASHHLRREVVGGGPEAAARDDQVHPLGRQEAERALEVRRAVADADDLGDVDTQLAEALGDPRAVPVDDAAGEHLRARHDDPGSYLGAHGQRRPRNSVGWTPPESIWKDAGRCAATSSCLPFT